MEVDATMEGDPNRSDDFHSIEIDVTANHAYSVSSVEADAVVIDDDNDEEKLHLDTLTLTCHQIQSYHNVSQRSEATSGIESLPIELLWSTMDGSLKSLLHIWSASTSTTPSSSKSILHKSSMQYGKAVVSDRDIETVLSCLLSLWNHSIDVFSSDVQSAPIMTSIILTSIHLLSRTMRHQRWKHEIVHHQLDKFVRLVTRTASFFLLVKLSDKSNNHNVEERKNDDSRITESIEISNFTLHPERYIPKSLFQLIKDVAYKSDNGTNSNTTLSDYMNVLYEEIYPIICDDIVSSNTEFMIDTCGILWRWTFSLAQSMARNVLVWKAIKNMWIQSNKTFEGIDVHGTVCCSLAAVVGMLISSVSSDEIKSNADEISHSSTSSFQCCSFEQNASISTIETQDWLIPMLLKGIRSTDSSVNEIVDFHRRCLRTLRCIISATWGKSFVYQYVNHKDLTLDLLGIIRTSKKDTDVTRSLACEVVGYILRDGCSDVQLAPYIEMSLVETITGSYHDVTGTKTRGTSSTSNLVFTACQALTASLQYSPWNRSTGCFAEAMFREMLYSLRNKIDEPSYHRCFVNLFLQLVAEEQLIDVEYHENKARTTRIKDICNLLASYATVLETLAILLSPNTTSPDFDLPRRNVIHILMIFIDNDDDAKTIKKHMATDEHLLTALVNACLMNNIVGPLKDKAKRTILTLISEL